MDSYIWCLNLIGEFDVGSFKTIMDPYFFTFSAFIQQDNNILYLYISFKSYKYVWLWKPRETTDVENLIRIKWGRFKAFDVSFYSCFPEPNIVAYNFWINYHEKKRSSPFSSAWFGLSNWYKMSISYSMRVERLRNYGLISIFKLMT